MERRFSAIGTPLFFRLRRAGAEGVPTVPGLSDSEGAKVTKLQKAAVCKSKVK